jgi:hypothetical protein
MKYMLFYLLLFNPAFANDTFDFELPNLGIYRNCESQIDCIDKMNCKIVVKKDARNCRKCLAINPFGGCLAKGNDPTCEVSKASQNAFYEAQAASNRLDCELRKQESKSSCEMNKILRTTECETTKRNEETSISSDTSVSSQNQELIKLTENAARMTVSNLVINELGKLIPNIVDTDLYFFQYTNYESFYMKISRFFKPNKYLLKNDIEAILDESPKSAYSFIQYTLVDLNYYLKVEDVIRAFFVAELFEQFGKIGVATLVKSEQVNLPLELDNKVIEICEQLEKISTTFRCNTKVELFT